MNEERVSTIYPSIYHYTNDSGLEGILRTKSLWATDYRFLNDTTELLVFIEALKHFIKFVDGISLEKQKSHIQEYEELCRGLIGFLNLAPHYLICFCPEDQYGTKNGRLSQWVKYGKDSGYAIEFKTSLIEKMLEEEHGGETDRALRYPVGIRFHSVGYFDDITSEIRRDGFRLNDNEKTDDNQVITEIKVALKKLFEVQTRTSQSAVDSTLSNESIHELMVQLSCSASRIKHYGFHEEREIRIVAPAVMGEDMVKMKPTIKPKTVYFRPQDKAPHIVVFEETTFDDLFKQAVKSIIVGPGGHQERRKTKVHIMLKKYGYDYDKINIKCSDIPYVI